VNAEPGHGAGEDAELWLVRHGETAWSRAGRHTGRTDVPLTARGREQARALAGVLGGREFRRVRTSPLARARETCALAGFAAEVDADLAEWDYGAYEGRTTAELGEEQPGFDIWEARIPAGEALSQVAARVGRVIDRAVADGARTLVFAHGHVLRILVARWLGLAGREGRLFRLDAAGVSVLGHEHGRRVIACWNVPVRLSPDGGEARRQSRGA